ncbi:MAG: hypothetical protein M3O50_14310 [Myxococcota bacterium]|nr:hypothetical protein [Myxococcota bacterium]
MKPPPVVVTVTGMPAAAGQDGSFGRLPSVDGPPLDDPEPEPPPSAFDDPVDPAPSGVAASPEDPSSEPPERASPDAPLDPVPEDADGLVPSGDPLLVAASVEPRSMPEAPVLHEAHVERQTILIAPRARRKL